MFVLFCFIYLFFNQMHTNVIYERTPRHETSTVQSQQAFASFRQHDQLLLASENQRFVVMFCEWGFVYVHSINGRNVKIAHQRSWNKNLPSVLLSELLLQHQQSFFFLWYNAQIRKTVFTGVFFIL